MRPCMIEIKNLLKSKMECIWITTYEEDAVIKDITEIANNDLVGYGVHTWSHTSGLKQEPLSALSATEPPDKSLAAPRALFSHIQTLQSSMDTRDKNVFILKDFHLLNDSHEVKRLLRDAKEAHGNNHNPIIVVSPVVNIPVEHEKLFTVFHYDLPSRDEIKVLIEKMSDQISKAVQAGRDFKEPTDDDKKRLLNACIGLTYNEISDVFAKSLVKYKELSLEAVMEEKIQLVQKSGVLDYMIPKYTFDDIGGNEAFKQWILEIEESYTQEASDFGVSRPKGYLALGVPGTSKSVSAESIANKWGFPLLRLNMSKIMDKMVGSSERKIEQAFRVAKACSPAVLLIDEVEKALAGVASSNSSDSGTLARVFGKTLEFLNEEHDVFVVMTSNDVSQLPPELTRAGRLDAMWYFSLPEEKERQEIFRIHLGKTGKDVSNEIICTAAKESDTFTGAEIAEISRIAVRKAFYRFKKDGIDTITEEDIAMAREEVIPIYRSSKEKIAGLESWADGRARRTNKTTDSMSRSKREDSIMEGILRLER